MRGRTLLLGGALGLAACGGSGDVATSGPGATGGSGAPATAPPGDVAPHGAAALDCRSGTASGLTFTEAPPTPGETRGPATVVADALRTVDVLPEAADAVESAGADLERDLERDLAVDPGRRGPGPASEVATDVGADADVDVTATVEAAEPGTPADVAVSRDDRVVAVVSVSERRAGYWGLDQLWACSEEVTVTEYDE